MADVDPAEIVEICRMIRANQATVQRIIDVSRQNVATLAAMTPIEIANGISIERFRADCIRTLNGAIAVAEGSIETGNIMIGLADNFTEVAERVVELNADIDGGDWWKGDNDDDE